MNYQRINIILGWVTFLIASIVYLMTIEHTASFWDCGEYIATANGLQVGHPPGAPLFQMLGRFFALLGGSDANAALMVNVMSALSSSFTILFLFWTITALGRKISELNGAELTDGKIYTIMGSALVGALAYTFSDSFWFSAVEGEVYAMSSFFTAVVFWAILRWERVADEPQADRWLVFIAYLIGLSIGVHLLNLLCIPAIVFIYFFRKFEVTPGKLILTGLISVVLLAGIQNGIIPGIVKLSASFELFFVNTVGLPYNSGTVIYFLLVITGIIVGLWYTKKHGKPGWNSAILSFTVLLIGYSSFIMLVIRANASTPINENAPKDAISLLSYLNREQYGSNPLAYGQYYNAPVIGYEDGNPIYMRAAQDNTVTTMSTAVDGAAAISRSKVEDKYVIGDDKKGTEPKYDDKFCTAFPRMWSGQGSHEQAYREWAGIRANEDYIENKETGEKIPQKISFGKNMRYFFSYQVGWMYWRYFLWNFAGKQNDVQGHGNPTEGNWITGFTGFDEWRTGVKGMPESLTNNKATNKLYALPLILGLIGIFYHFNRNAKDAFVVLMLFFFTGLAIVLYLNQTPYQPRERDYAYVGSFYAFAIWIGLGVMGIAELLSKKLSQKTSALASTFVCLLAVPVLMANQEWDDHDRSKRYTAHDFAIDYLESCAPNAILFTNGDNDTFPLWYAQEVEGIRRDVRVCNLSLLNTDWYINQMKKKAYESEAVPFTLPESKYRMSNREYIPFLDKGIKGFIPVKELVEFMTSDDTKKQVQVGNGKWINYLPTRKMTLAVDSVQVVKTGTVDASLANRIVKSIDWEVSKGYIYKSDLMMLDLIAHNNWNRPVYYAVTTGPESYIGLQSHFQLEGLAYRLVPIKTEEKEQQLFGSDTRVATDLMYNNVMNKFKWGGMNTKGVYLDENILRMCTNLRIQMGTLANALISENKKDSAMKVLDKCLEVMPEENVPYDATILGIVTSYYDLKADEKANAISKRLFDIFEKDLLFYMNMNGKKAGAYESEKNRAGAVLQRLAMLARQYKQDALTKDFEDRMKIFMGGQ